MFYPLTDRINQYRRRLLVGLTALPFAASSALRTPSAAEGPFYPLPAMRFDDADSDLVRVDGQVRAAGGEIVRLQGRVLDASGQAVSGARVEIWQCDARGRYLHWRDSGGPRDPGFQGFGQSITDAGGTYGFRTIKPVPYPGRTPHIHVKVWVDGHDRLTTQFYLQDHPYNQRDGLYRNLSTAELDRVTMIFNHHDEEPVATLDLVV